MTIAKKMKSCSILALLVLTLSSCSWLKQPGAPVEPYSPDATIPTTSGSNQSGDYGSTPTTTPSYPTYPSSSSGGTYTPSTAPVDPSATFHTVVSGDTLYNISKRYGVSQADVMAWNNMNDATVKLGTRLRVKSSGSSVASTGGSTTSTNTGSSTSSSTSSSTTSTSGSTSSVGGISWIAPTQGSVIARYNSTNKGIDIAGTMGQPVVASAAGKVVYSGTGLKGYGKLIIIQHNQIYLSAYAHNKTILVKEGQNVTRGQKIAEMGNTDADRAKLHFEIRKQGQPIDPAPFIKL